MKFDKEMSLRNAAYGALVGFLGAKHLHMTQEAGAALGFILAPLLDACIFTLKKRIKGS